MFRVVAVRLENNACKIFKVTFTLVVNRIDKMSIGSCHLCSGTYLSLCTNYSLET